MARDSRVLYSALSTLAVVAPITSAGPPKAPVVLDARAVASNQCDTFIAISAANDYSLALKPDGSVVAWGRNNFGQTEVPPPNRDFIAIAAGETNSLGLKADGSIIVWGESVDSQVNVPEPNTDFVSVSTGRNFSLGLKANGSIVGWGSNTDGQLTIPSPNSGFVAISAGDEHVLGLKGNGSIVAWGSNVYGQANVPAPNTAFVAVDAGDYHSLGLKADGSIVAWGDNTFGQTTVPLPNSGFIAVSAGAVHSLGLASNGSIITWGENGQGQGDVPAPNSDFEAVSGGGEHSLGLKSDGTVVAWGCGNPARDYGECELPVSAADLCDDRLPCTLDTCDEGRNSCVHTPNDNACDDGRYCTGSEHCDPSLGCIPGAAPECDDGVPCTLDSCDQQSDVCTHTVDDRDCDDARYCNGPERCDLLLGCTSGDSPECDDAVNCTLDACDVTTDRCVHTPNDDACNDGLFCDGEEWCNEFTGCRPGAPPCSEDQDCNEQSRRCEPSRIPTTGTWGLAILALLLLAAAKVRFARRTPA